MPPSEKSRRTSVRALYQPINRRDVPNAVIRVATKQPFKIEKAVTRYRMQIERRIFQRYDGYAVAVMILGWLTAVKVMTQM